MIFPITAALPLFRRLAVTPKKEKPGAEKPKKPKKPQKPKAKINADQIVYALEKLPPVLGRALKRTGKSIHIRPLQIYVLVAGSDSRIHKMIFPITAALPLFRRLAVTPPGRQPHLPPRASVRLPPHRIRRAFEIRKTAKLSQPALEVLAVVAYYQPVTRARPSAPSSSTRICPPSSTPGRGGKSSSPAIWKDRKKAWVVR